MFYCDYVYDRENVLSLLKNKKKNVEKESSYDILECQFKSIFECVHMEASKWYYCMLK